MVERAGNGGGGHLSPPGGLDGAGDRLQGRIHEIDGEDGTAER
ncbi:hypothetical protein [Streptomyces sp. AB3(2024)]